MSGVNKVIIVGRLGADPEMKATSQGSNICRFTVATSEAWTGKDGQKTEKTEWHRIVAFGKLAEICGKYLAKGRQVYLEGRLETSSYEKNGVKMYSTAIIANTLEFLGDKAADNTRTNNTQSTAGQGGDVNFGDFGPEPTFNQNEDIPF